MKSSNTSERLKEIIALRQVKQVDIIDSTGITKGALSSYITGRYEPKQDKIYILAKYFDVSEAWLMGYDVPMEKIPAASAGPIDAQKAQLLKYYDLLNDEGINRLLEQAQFFASQDKYKEIKSGESAG